jgi:hypothetical protein
VKFLSWVCALVAAGCSTATAATLHVDTFDSTSQGWAVAGFTPATHEPTGGAGDGTGYIIVPSGTNLATYNLEESWIGDYTSIGANHVRVDLRVPVGKPALAMRVVVFGPDTTDQRFTSTVAQTIPADGVWRNYTFSLASADLVPTQAFDPPLTYSQTMGNVQRIMLRHNPGPPSHNGTSIIGELHVDNMELASAPVAGDFDGNGLVNAADLTHPTLGWKTRYGTDLDGNDFLDWQRGLNVPVAAAVPEPATLAEIPFVVGLLLRRRAAIRPLS